MNEHRPHPTTPTPPSQGDDEQRRDRLRDQLHTFARETVPDLALPGGGATPTRLAALAELGRRELSLARLGEAHADAVAIMAELGHDGDASPGAGDRDGTGDRSGSGDRRGGALPVATYGVWAARGRDEVVHAHRQGDRWRLTGHKPWCTGVGIVSHGLVTAESADGPLLFRIAMDQPGIEVAAANWVAPAFSATGTVTLALDVEVTDADRIGAPGAYLERPGFWHGATGVAACWSGGLVGVTERAAGWWRRDGHAVAHRAAIDAEAWGLVELVAAAGREADAHPMDGPRAHRTALRVRHLVDAAVERCLTHVRRGCGPAPFAFDGDLGRHVAELELYVRQSHAERDLEALGRLDDDRAAPPG